MKRLIVGALVVCVIIVLIAAAVIRHVNNKQDHSGATITDTRTTQRKTGFA